MAAKEPIVNGPQLQPRLGGAAAAYLAWIISERLVESPGGCWEWQGATNRPGYGIIDLQNWDSWPESTVQVHRIVYRLCVGPISDGICVCHRCDNPGCSRPSHLFIGTNSDNVADKVAKRRQASGQAVRIDHGHLRGENIVTALLTADQVMEIRRAEVNGESQTAIAKRYEVSVATVNSIVHGKSWAHLPVLARNGKTRICPRCGATVQARQGRYRNHLASCPTVIDLLEAKE